MRYLIAALGGAVFATVFTGVVSWIFILSSEQAWYLWASMGMVSVIAALVVAEDTK